ncbi:hypothetical protein [Streptomyces albidoflavus]|uniref:hypothetical protein n=1 Tax=Streptomyces albidoflavus TaxID=1886 RepID=UPI0033B2C439
MRWTGAAAPVAGDPAEGRATPVAPERRSGLGEPAPSVPLRGTGAWLGEVDGACRVLCAGGVSPAVRAAGFSGVGRFGPGEGDGVEGEGAELLDEGEPEVVAGLFAGVGPGPDRAIGGTGFPDFAGEACRWEEVAAVPAVGEALPGAAPPAGPGARPEVFGVARCTGMSGPDRAAVRSAGVTESGRAAGAGAGEGAANSVLLPVPRPAGALPAPSPPEAGAGVAGRSWRETARCTGALPGVLPPPVVRADGRAEALAAPETGAASAAALVPGACPWRGRSG